MPDENISIDLSKDGPLIVSNLKVLENSWGEVIECNDKIALCRCGASNNKPFCDGSHKKIGFSGERESGLNISREREYKGKEISIFYNAGLCYHVEES